MARDTEALASTQPSAPRPRKRWFLIAAALLTLAVIASSLYVARFSPVRAANSGPYFCDGCHDLETGRLTYLEGGQIAVGTSLFNDGPIPIRITGISLPTGEMRVVLLEDAWVDMAKPDAGGQSAPGDPALKPFEPFTLSHGESEWVVVRARYANCERYPPGTYARWTHIEVTFEVLGVITRHELVSVPEPLRIESPNTCPGRP